MPSIASVYVNVLPATGKVADASNHGSLSMTAMTSRVPGPGWYSDPSGGSEREYWNGREWTDSSSRRQAGRAEVGHPPSAPVRSVFCLLLVGSRLVSSSAPPGFEELGAGLVIVGVLTAVAAVCVRVRR